MIEGVKVIIQPEMVARWRESVKGPELFMSPALRIWRVPEGTRRKRKPDITLLPPNDETTFASLYRTLGEWVEQENDVDLEKMADEMSRQKDGMQ